MFTIHDINLGAVLVASFTKVAIGSFWYSPLILGKSWMKENKLCEDDFKKGHSLWLMALFSFLFAFVAALGMAFFIPPASTILTGAGTGALISLVWVSASKANTALYENFTIKHYLIHAGYDIFSYTAMGAILGGWC